MVVALASFELLCVQVTILAHLIVHAKVEAVEIGTKNRLWKQEIKFYIIHVYILPPLKDHLCINTFKTKHFI